jgi:hypothetical protein
MTCYADLRVLIDGQSRFQRREISRYNGAFPIALPIRDQDRFLTLAACAQATFISYNAGTQMAAYVAPGATGSLAPAFGQWSVGYQNHSVALTTDSFTAFTAGQFQQAAAIDASLAGIAIWETSWAENMLGVQYSGSKNWNEPGGSAMSTTTPGQIIVDQTVGSPFGTNMPVLRWTAPQDGTISIGSSFRAICENANTEPIDRAA